MRHTLCMIKLMKINLTLAISTLLICSACGAVHANDPADDPKGLTAQAKDNITKANRYHQLANEAKLKQAALQSFVATWIEECKIKGNVLQMGQDGDPACVAPPSATNLAPAQAPAVSQPAQTKTPITPAKK